jgi:peptide/nickel transport system ATP-binding protein
VAVEDVAAWYGRTEVLQSVSLSIRKGECLALVGESGSGKTTLARSISGLHTQTRGELRLGGETVAWGTKRRTTEQLRAIQYVFQNPFNALNPRKTVQEIIAQPLQEFGLDAGRSRVTELLDEVSLSSRYGSRYPAQLSGGERQRVAIARALAPSPDVLVCDEITSALDVSVQASVLALLHRLHEDNELTVLFVTHNLAVVRAIADGVVVLDRGVIVEAGPVNEVLDNPRDKYTRALMRDTPGLQLEAVRD